LRTETELVPSTIPHASFLLLHGRRHNFPKAGKGGPTFGAEPFRTLIESRKYQGIIVAASKRRAGCLWVIESTSAGNLVAC
jgi:hypothetical protein